MTTNRTAWLIPAGLVTLSMVPALAGTARLGQLTDATNATAEAARFFDAPLPIAIHIVAAIVYSLLGAFQFAPQWRKRHRRWHRVSGRILVPAALAVALSGLWMTLTYPWPAGDGVAVYLERLVAGSLMLASIILGVDAIRRRDFNAHGHWMIRSYAIGLGAGTQVLTHLPYFMLVDTTPGELPRAVMMGAGWAINILVAEAIIRRPVQRVAALVARVA